MNNQEKTNCCEKCKDTSNGSLCWQCPCHSPTVECDFCKGYPDGDFGRCGRCSRKIDEKNCTGCKNGKREGCYNCGSFSNFFHKATPEEKEKVILEVVKEANEEQKMTYERNYSHTCCWKQLDFDMEEHDLDPKTTPVCGIPLEKHKQCCLCDTPSPTVEPNKIAKEICETIAATSPTIRAASPDGTRTMTGNPSPTVATSTAICGVNCGHIECFSTVATSEKGIYPPLTSEDYLNSVIPTPNESEDWETELWEEWLRAIEQGVVGWNPRHISNWFVGKFKHKMRDEKVKSYQRGREEVNKDFYSGDIRVFDGKVWRKVKPEDIFVQVEKAKLEVLSLAVQEIEKKAWDESGKGDKLVTLADVESIIKSVKTIG